MRLHYESITRVSCDTCLIGHLGRRIRWWHSFSHLTSGQVKFRSKRSNFENRNLFWKTYLSCPVLSQDSKNVICFILRPLEIPKIEFKVVTSLPLPGFWTIAQPKIKILARNFVQLSLAHSSNIYISFFRYLQKNDFVRIYYWQIKIWFCGVKKQTFRKFEITTS